MFPKDTIPTQSEPVDEDAIDDVERNADTSYSLIVSHNSRIQCLLGKLGVDPGDAKIRFQNCCILKIILSDVQVNIGFVYIELIYSGELSEKDALDDSKRFYTSSKESAEKDPKLVWFKPVMFTMDKYKLGLHNVTLNKPYVFFLVRHGQSLHNETNTRGLVLDTTLTDDGVKSANKAATVLDDYLKTHFYEPKQPRLNSIKLKITEYFVSDLYRTRQTMNAFRPGYYRNVYVLPCASEVGTVGKNGDCDSSGQIWNKLARENYSSCTPDEIRFARTSQNSSKCSANWDTYLKFYGNQMRGESNVFGTRMKCRDTNMLAMAIYIIDFKSMPLESFMTRDRYVPGLTNTIVRPQQRPSPPQSAPVKNEMKSTGWFSYGGTKRKKLKRKRTHRR